jgi:4'-phosphopantetheinyl transferase
VLRRFKFSADQKRALVSRLMQRRAVQTAVGIPWDEIQIKRTKGKKPFLANEVRMSHPSMRLSVSPRSLSPFAAARPKRNRT